LDLHEIVVRPVCSGEEARYQELMRQHHYLGALPKISETLWYVATWREEWVALLSFSASALKGAARDGWIGWDFRRRYSRLKLIANNSRFLILPDWHISNLGSRVLAVCQRRVASDWKRTFGHGVVLLETFVDPARFRGTVYRAANWIEVGATRGFRRTRRGYSARPQSPKMVFLRPLQARARELLSGATLPPSFCPGESKMTLTAAQMQSLPAFFAEIPDPRRAQGRRHRLRTVLAIAAGAVLCGMRGYHAIADWAQSLGQKARKRFGCRWENGRYGVPSEYVIRDVLIRVKPADLDRALRRWNGLYAQEDQTLAIDGKTMCNALDEHGHQTHIMSVVGHETQTCYTQKKWALCR
jgi:Domain of unknown function (DUF4338)/DDE_Tnp_1-associated